jgi:hypothetical protein
MTTQQPLHIHSLCRDTIVYFRVSRSRHPRFPLFLAVPHHYIRPCDIRMQNPCRWTHPTQPTYPYTHAPFFLLGAVWDSAELIVLLQSVQFSNLVTHEVSPCLTFLLPLLRDRWPLVTVELDVVQGGCRSREARLLRAEGQGKRILVGVLLLTVPC